MLGTQAAALQRPGCLRTAQPRRLRRPVRCFKDGDSPSSKQGRATVRFSIPQQTRFGEHVAVVGSFSGWDTQAPVQLQWGEGSVWSGEAELPVGERLEYKYVVVSERSGQVTWQPGGNLVLELGPGGDQTVLVLDDWLGRTHEVRPAATPTTEPVAVPVGTTAAQPGQLEAAPAPTPMVPAAAQLDQPAELEQPALHPVAPEMPQEAATEAAGGEQVVEAAAEPEPEVAAEEPSAPAVLVAAQSAESYGAAEHEPAAAAATEVLAPAPAHPTAAQSWRAVLESANQLFVSPQAAPVTALASGNGAAAAGTLEPPKAGDVSKVSPASKDSPAREPAPLEPAAAVEDSGAAASWRAVLQVASQPYVPPAAVAVSGEQPKEEAPAVVTVENGASTKGADAATVVLAPEEPAAGEAAAAPAAAPIAKAASAPAAEPSLNGSQPAAGQAKPEAAAPAAPASPKVVPAPLPTLAAAASNRAGAKGMAPWLRLLLAAALVVAAVVAFLKSPWAAARWALSAL